MVVDPGRMIDSFLSFPDAESLPLYRMVLKLACVQRVYCNPFPAKPLYGSHRLGLVMKSIMELSVSCPIQSGMRLYCSCSPLLP